MELSKKTLENLRLSTRNFPAKRQTAFDYSKQKTTKEFTKDFVNQNFPRKIYFLKI
jgi:hypothetical protein